MTLATACPGPSSGGAISLWWCYQPHPTAHTARHLRARAKRVQPTPTLPTAPCPCPPAPHPLAARTSSSCGFTSDRYHGPPFSCIHICCLLPFLLYIYMLFIARSLVPQPLDHGLYTRDPSTWLQLSLALYLTPKINLDPTPALPAPCTHRFDPNPQTRSPPLPAPYTRSFLSTDH